MEENFANLIFEKELVMKISRHNIIYKNQIIQFKYDKGSEYTFFLSKIHKCSRAYEKILDIISHQGHANQNHSEIPLDNN